MKFKKFTPEMLDKVNLFVLREIGRMIGVKAPAAKNKDDLIREIIAVQNGEMPPTPPSNLGAPQKTKVDLSAFLETNDDIVLFRQKIDHAALAFISPVDAHDCAVFHVFCLLLMCEAFK